MDNRPVNAYIPPNLSSTGGILGGMLDTRRVIEGMLGGGLAFVLYLFIRPLISGMIPFYICLLLGVVLLAVGLLGVNGEPFSVFLFNIANYEQRRIFVTLRPPMPDMEGKKKKEKSETLERDNKFINLLRKRDLRKGSEAEEE